MAEMTLREIDEEMTRLRNLRYELEKEDIEKFKVEAQKHVGRCFKTDEGRYVMVLDVPHENPTLHGIDFNRYQFPALFVRGKGKIANLPTMKRPLLPFWTDTIFSGAWGDGTNLLEVKCHEITPDEFYSHFTEVMHEFRLSIKDIVEARKEKTSDD